MTNLPGLVLFYMVVLQKKKIITGNFTPSAHDCHIQVLIFTTRCEFVLSPYHNITNKIGTFNFWFLRFSHDCQHIAKLPQWSVVIWKVVQICQLKKKSRPILMGLDFKNVLFFFIHVWNTPNRIWIREKVQVRKWCESAGLTFLGCTDRRSFLFI